MRKLCFCFALALSTAQVSAEITDAEYQEDLAAIGTEQLAKDAQEDIELDQALAEQLLQQGIPQVLEVQWGGGGRRGRWVCTARNRSGRVFTGVSQSRSQAQRNAMWRCRDRSRSSCWLRGCR